MKPKIVSLGVALPAYSYTQQEIFDVFRYPRHFKRIFIDSGIDKRHFCIPLEKVRHLTLQEQQEEYHRSAIELSKQAIIDCLDGRDPKEIGCLVYCSCTGITPGPTIGHYLMREMGFSPNVTVTNITMMGCEGGGFPGLRRAADFTTATGKLSLVVATELCFLNYFPEPDNIPNPENDYQCLRANAIFADASSVVLIGYDDDWRHPSIVDQETYTNTDYIGDLGFTWRDGRLMVLLSKKIPKVAPLVVKPAVDAVLRRQGLRIADIKWWVIHAAGRAVLRNIQSSLGIADEAMKLSLDVLRDNGNCSSATVGIVGKRLMSENISRGDFAAVITVGPGVSGGMSLLRFGNETTY